MVIYASEMSGKIQLLKSLLQQKKQNEIQTHYTGYWYGCPYIRGLQTTGDINLLRM